MARRAASAARVDRHGKRSSREWGFRTRARRTGTGRTAPARTRPILPTGYAEHPDGLPGPQLAVALQLAIGQMHRLLVVGQDGAWQDPEGRLGVGRRAPK